MMRLLISGGPGSGCTTTAAAVGERLGVQVFDSDSYFHKPTDPPFQEQYTPEERRAMLDPLLGVEPSWILSGSVATWHLDSLEPTHGVLLNTPKEVRLDRLMNRQRNQFGSKIEPGGVMQEEHQSFMEWAAEYENRTGSGRNLGTDRAFLEARCKHFLVITGNQALEQIAAKIIGFLTKTNTLLPLAPLQTAIAEQTPLSQTKVSSAKMPNSKDEFAKRIETARMAIKAAYGTNEDEYGATLFVSHHLEELDPAYWEEHFKTAAPEPSQILDALVLRSEFDENDEIDSLDFTLPGDGTDYVLCVTFDEKGEVADISMES